MIEGLWRKAGIVLLPVVLGVIIVADPSSPLRGLVKTLDALCAAREGGVLTLKGVRGQVNISRDDVLGIPHIYAETEIDMIFGQGYLQAKDRLFQLEILRKLAHGELSELIGEKGIPMDKWHRSLGFNRLSEGDWALCKKNNPELAPLISAFTDGMNAYLGEKDTFFPTVPIELWMLRSFPKPFRPQDVMAFGRWHSSAMNKGWQNELLFTKLTSTLPDEVIEALKGGLRYTTGVDPNTDPYHRMGAHVHEPYVWNDLSDLNDPNDMLAGVNDNGGSNAWVIGGNFTKSGKPIVANDPHLPLTLPSAWHMVHMVSKKEDLDLTGMSIPLLPYVVSGTNQHIANGVTLGRCDVDDVFLEKIFEVTNEDGDVTRMYLDSDGKQKPLEIREEVIQVKGGASITHKVEITPRGPLLCGLLNRVASVEGEEHKIDCSLKTLTTVSPETLVYEFDGCPMNGFRTLAYGRNFEDFRKGLSQMSIAQLNIVFGDENGNIGYQMSGRVPRRLDIGDSARHGWNASHDWQGWVPFDELPSSKNPPRGFVISANHKPYYTDSEPSDLGRIFQHGWRSMRIEELMNATLKDRKVTAEDSVLWQRDYFSVPAHHVVEHLKEKGAPSEGWAAMFADFKKQGLLGAQQTTEAQFLSCIKILTNWDAEMGAESPAAALYASFKEVILRRVLGVAVSRGKSEAVPYTSFEWQTTAERETALVDEILGVGQVPAGKISNDLEGMQSALVLRILHRDPEVVKLLKHAGDPTPHTVTGLGVLDAYHHIRNATQVEDPEKFSWGALHPAQFMHSLGRGGFPLNHIFNLEVGPVSGDTDTLMLSAYLHQRAPVKGLPVPPQLYTQRGFGSTSRYVLDFGTPAGVKPVMRLCLAPGNSGRISSPHYGSARGFLTEYGDPLLPILKEHSECEVEEILKPE